MSRSTTDQRLLRTLIEDLGAVKAHVAGLDERVGGLELGAAVRPPASTSAAPAPVPAGHVLILRSIDDLPPAVTTIRPDGSRVTRRGARASWPLVLDIAAAAGIDTAEIETRLLAAHPLVKETRFLPDDVLVPAIAGLLDRLTATPTQGGRP